MLGKYLEKKSNYWQSKYWNTNYNYPERVHYRAQWDKYEKLYNIYEGIKTTIIVGLMLIGVVITPILLVGMTESYKCNTYSEMTGFETKYRFFSGCYVNYHEQWMLENQLKFGSLELKDK